MESISADNNQMLLINSHSFLSLTMISSDSKRRVPAGRHFEECKSWTFHYASTSKLAEVTIDPAKRLPDVNPSNNTWKAPAN